MRQAFDVEAQNETKHASKLMARMYTAMEKGYPADIDPKQRDHEISVTLARILFLMFGDDTDMWQPRTSSTTSSSTTPHATAPTSAPSSLHLFAYLDTPDRCGATTDR